MLIVVFFFNDTATTEIYTLSLHDALPIWHCDTLFHEIGCQKDRQVCAAVKADLYFLVARSEEHTSELQSLTNLVCRLLLEKKKWPHAPCGGQMVHTPPGSVVWPGARMALG